MKCSNCGADMVKGASAALCLNCGHTEPISGTSPEIAKTSQPAPAATTVSTPPPADTEAPVAPPAKPTPAPMPVTDVPPAPSVPPELSPTPAVVSDPTPAPVSIPAAQAPVAAAPVPASGSAPAPTPAPAPVVAAVIPTTAAAALSQPVAPVVPSSTVPGATVAGVVAPVEKSSRTKKLLLVAGIPALIVILLGGGTAYAYLGAPKTALLSYASYLASTKTATYSATITSTDSSLKGDEAKLGSTTATLAGSYDIHDRKNPKADLTIKGSLSGSSVQAEVRSIGNTIYFQPTNVGILALLGIPSGSSWYKYTTTSTDTKSACTDSATDLNVGALPFKETKLVSPAQKIDGHLTMHYSGMLDQTKLKAYVDKVNKKLSKSCQIDTSDIDSIKNDQITYDVYRGIGFDRLQLAIKDGTTAVTMALDTSKYNQKVSIDAPANAKDLTTTLKSAFSDQTTDVTTDDTTNSDSNTALGRDALRKSDLRNLQAGLEAVYTSSEDSSYPTAANFASALTGGSEPILDKLPVDPTNKAPYTYRYTLTDDGQNYKLDACLEVTGGGPDVVTDATCPSKSSYELMSEFSN